MEECKRLGKLIAEGEVDVAFVGVGENGHLAFNDPPPDFDTEEAFIVVELDEVCRKQQLGEGWFKSLDEVPTKAISMSVKQIMKSKHIICTVPDLRKAERQCGIASAMIQSRIFTQHLSSSSIQAVMSIWMKTPQASCRKSNSFAKSTFRDCWRKQSPFSCPDSKRGIFPSGQNNSGTIFLRNLVIIYEKPQGVVWF